MMGWVDMTASLWMLEISLRVLSHERLFMSREMETKLPITLQNLLF
jgi:hypothetical protein